MSAYIELYVVGGIIVWFGFGLAALLIEGKLSRYLILHPKAPNAVGITGFESVMLYIGGLFSLIAITAIAHNQYLKYPEVKS